MNIRNRCIKGIRARTEKTFFSPLSINTKVSLFTYAVIIDSERLSNSILTCLADPEMRKILDSVMIHSKSVNEISRETSIANTTTYRKIKWMVEEGLLIVSSIQITDDGKKTSLFRSALRSINIEYTNSEIKINAERNVDVFEKTAQDFFSLT
jgi:hypothetical protein